jgi:Ca2+/H+ antiporter, TMEM165/GDT1 family
VPKRPPDLRLGLCHEEPELSLTVIATVFAIIFPAELPDKTALASLLLGSRYRPLYVFAGVAAAFALHALLAVAAGSLLTLLPHRILQAVVAALFLLGAVLLLRGREEAEGGEDEHGLPSGRRATFPRVAFMSFGVILVAEFGDLTQIVTANLAAKYHQPLAVGIGSVLGLWAVAGLAIAGGRNLLRVIPLTWITRIAAAVMVVLACVSLLSAVRG